MINPFQRADVAAVEDYLAFELVPVLLDLSDYEMPVPCTGEDLVGPDLHGGLANGGDLSSHEFDGDRLVFWHGQDEVLRVHQILEELLGLKECAHIRLEL